MMLKPYYETPLGKLYHGDCLEIMPELEPVDLVLTDPPYPDWFVDLYKYDASKIKSLEKLSCKQLVFWSADVDVDFIMSYTSRHVWNKNPSNRGAQYEFIYERNGGKQRKVFSYYMINSTVAAKMTNDVFVDHPSQKPINLFKALVSEYKSEIVFDPFLGSGTTAVACERLKRRWIGIEIEEKYCEIAAKRIEQERKQLKMF